MEGIKKFINIVVMLYLVAAVLIYLDILNVGQNSISGFYTTFFLVGGVIMFLELIIENLYIMSLKRGHVHTQQKINELKAQLYDHKLEIQDIRKRQKEDSLAARPMASPNATAAPAQYDNPGNRYTANHDPVKPSPAGSDPVPPINPSSLNPNRPVIITPGRTSDSQNPDGRFSDKSDSF